MCFPQVEFPFTALTAEPQHIRISQRESSGNVSMACSSWEPPSYTQDRLCANHSNWLSAMLFLNFPVLFSLLAPTVFYLNDTRVLTLMPFPHTPEVYQPLSPKSFSKREASGHFWDLESCLPTAWVLSKSATKFWPLLCPGSQTGAGVPGGDTATALPDWRRKETRKQLKQDSKENGVQGSRGPHLREEGASSWAKRCFTCDLREE